MNPSPHFNITITTKAIWKCVASTILLAGIVPGQQPKSMPDGKTGDASIQIGGVPLKLGMPKDEVIAKLAGIFYVRPVVPGQEISWAVSSKGRFDRRRCQSALQRWKTQLCFQVLIRPSTGGIQRCRRRRLRALALLRNSRYSESTGRSVHYQRRSS